MNITTAIVKKLQRIDLSTETAVVERYESLANSPVLLQFLLHANVSDIGAAYQSSGENTAVITGELKDKLRGYATIGRNLNKRKAIKAIRRRIGLLFAEWEEEEKAGGVKASDGYIYAYAIERGFNPKGASLSEKDIEALNAVAECVFTTIEAYFIYSLTGKNTAVDSILSHKVGELTQEELKSLKDEAMGQISILFADEWESAGANLTASFEEEVNFFGEEAKDYYTEAIETMAANSIDFAVKLRFMKKQAEEQRKADEAEKESVKRAQATRYKGYIKA